MENRSGAGQEWVGRGRLGKDVIIKGEREGCLRSRNPLRLACDDECVDNIK